MKSERRSVSGPEALDILRAGNHRFVSGSPPGNRPMGFGGRDAAVSEQNPLAIILGCSDSRVPAELVFDQGLGDLFVIRVAGNIVAPSQVGSIEFAAERYGTRLVVVLGHSNCGAILATLDELRQATENRSQNLRSIVDRIRPSIEELMSSATEHDPDDLVRQAVRLNVKESVRHLRHGSSILEQLIEKQGLMIIGAEYSLETGVVRFFDNE
jgi:carbonic anhydrase